MFAVVENIPVPVIEILFPKRLIFEEIEQLSEQLTNQFPEPE